jgi:serine protease Do
MDEFLNNNLPEEEDEQEVSQNAEEKDFEPIYNPVNYTEVKPIEDYKPMSRGLKLFALILAAVILLTGTCLTGYLLGRNSVKISHPKVEVNLAAKPSDTDEMTEAEVYEEVNKSIVGIVAYNTSRKASQASGIVFSKEGYIVTNDHIYSDIAAAKFKIYTYDGKEYDAEYVAGDTVSDLAVLKVKGASLTPAKFGNSDDLFYGEHVVAIGRPNDATDASSITKGIVSAVNRRVQTTSNYSSRLIQTDSAINPGSSGGALVNMFGQVIGVTSSKLASVEYDAVGYAIPTTTMKRIVDELISNGKVVSRAKLGITYATIDSITAEMNGYDYKGILIDSVSEDSGLYGKAEKGDVITHINGIEITNDNIVLDIIENSRAGDKITVTIATNSGTVKTVEAKLSANIGESSYKAIEEKPEINKDGAFNFPEGE